MNIGYLFILSQILHFNILLGINGQSSLSKLLKLSCEGNIWQADKLLRQYDTADALHCLSAFEFILRGNGSGAVVLHKSAKQRNSTLIPPLASLHLSGEQCNGLGDIFYVTAVIIKQLVDTNLDTDTLINGHKTLITLLSDSGLSEEAEIHLQAALKINPKESNIRIRSLLLFPIVYKSTQHIISTRLRLQSRLDTLLEDKNYTLTVLDEFTLSPTFYLIYQGFNDMEYLQQLHRLYQQAHPALAISEISINIPKLKRIDNNDTINTSLITTEITHSTAALYKQEVTYNYHRKIRIGFVSAHFRTHSICKLFCGIITNLNTSKYDIFVFSALQEQHEDAMTWKLSKNSNIRFIRIGMTLIQNRREVVNRNIDILVYLDIGMDPATSTWSAARLAPIQVCIWGHPSTTGQGAIDYYLSHDYFHYGHDIYLSPTHYYPSNNASQNVSASMRRNDPDAVSQLELYDVINNININMSYNNLYNFNQAIFQNNNSNSYNSSNNKVYNNIGYPPDQRPLQRQVHADPQSIFSEQLVLLEDLGIHFQRPEYPLHVTDRITNETAFHQSLLNELITSNTSHQLRSLLQLKLRSKGTFLVCPQHLPKFHPFFDEVLNSLLLLSSSQTYIIILAPSTKKGIWKLLLEKRWRKKFGSLNYKRIIWVNNLNTREFMTLMAVSDVMLDPFPFGGGVTTLEALATCTPVVTLPSLQSVPALAAGMLVRIIHQMNLKEQETPPNKGGNNDNHSQDTSVAGRGIHEESLLRNLIVSSASDYVRAVLQLLPEYSPDLTSDVSPSSSTSTKFTDSPPDSLTKLLSSVKATICKYNNVLYSSNSSVTAWELFLNRVVHSDS